MKPKPTARGVILRANETTNRPHQVVSTWPNGDRIVVYRDEAANVKKRSVKVPKMKWRFPFWRREAKIQ